MSLATSATSLGYSGPPEESVTSKIPLHTELITADLGRVLRSLWLRLCEQQWVGEGLGRSWSVGTDGLGRDLSQKEGCIRAAWEGITAARTIMQLFFFCLLFLKFFFLQNKKRELVWHADITGGRWCSQGVPRSTINKWQFLLYTLHFRTILILAACFIFEETPPLGCHLGTHLYKAQIHLSPCICRLPAHFVGNFHIFQHLDTAFAYTQRQAARGYTRVWGSWNVQNLLAPGWYGDIYSPFRHNMEEKKPRPN